MIADTDVVRLDVRTADEYAEGHIDNAINIDVLKNDFESKATATLHDLQLVRMISMLSY